MSDWPALAIISPPVITTLGGIFGQSAVGSSGNISSSTWPVANKAIFAPVLVPTIYVARKMFVMNGSVVSGNIDVGIYDVAGNLLVSIGSTVQTGTTAMQVFDITDTTLLPGTYYLAVALSNTTGTIIRALTGSFASANNAAGKAGGTCEMASAFPLPNPATFATLTAEYIPLIGMTNRAVL